MAHVVSVVISTEFEMGIAEDLKEAEDELAFNFSQDQWEDALIAGWRKDSSLAGVLYIASGLTRQITPKEWGLLQFRASKLKPSLNRNSLLKQKCRTWIASHARHANNYLYDGLYEKAKLCFTKFGVDHGYISRSSKEEKQNNKKAIEGLLVIKVRERDVRTDWKVCK